MCYNRFTIHIDLFNCKRFKDGGCAYKNTGSSYLKLCVKWLQERLNQIFACFGAKTDCFASLASLYTQIKFSIKNSLIYTAINNVHISHNAPYLLSKILHKHCFQFLLGTAVIPRRNEKQRLYKFWEANNVNYERYASGILNKMEYISTWTYENLVSKHFVIFPKFHRLIACLLRCLLMSFVFACFLVRDLCRSANRISI